MIKHIVMWKLKDKNKKENSLKIKNMIEDLKDKINVILNIEIGININTNDCSYDIVLYSEFENEKDLNFYQKNPLHIECVNFIKNVSIDRKAVDYIK